MKPAQPKMIELPRNEVEELLQRAAGALDPEDYQLIKAVVESYAYLTNLVEDRSTTIQRLRKLLFGASSEKTATVFHTPPDQPRPGTAPPAATSGDEAAGTPTPEAAVPRKGHGRHGAEDYGGAEKVPVSHPSLHVGAACPECQQGIVYESTHPGVLVRFAGQAPLRARIYELQKLRCNLCGHIFTADPPLGVGPEKYDATAGSMIALLKYGSGLPFQRLEGLQASLGLPLPAATQWDIVHDLAERIEPVYEELIRQAAQGAVLFNDDTTIKILELMGKRAAAQRLAELAADPAATDPPIAGASRETGTAERRGMFTSGIVSTHGGRRIALFFSGRQHAGENLADVLARRSRCAMRCPATCRRLCRPYGRMAWRTAGGSSMSLIHTCQLCGANPFDYLTALQNHAAKLASDPARWLPWNYRDESGTRNVDTAMAKAGADG